MPVFYAIQLNSVWHSRLPEFTYPKEKCLAVGAEFQGIRYAVAIWSQPSARQLNFTGRYELRRLAISPDAPKNTASRMLRIMRDMIKKRRPDIKILISYQDTEVHTGSIYKAAGWQPVTSSPGGQGWSRHKNASGKPAQSAAQKIRWELDLNPTGTIPSAIQQAEGLK